MAATLLVIENEKLNAELLRRRLQKRGYIVIEENNGLKAKALLEEIQPQLILTDLSLNGINGWKLASELKANPKTASIPIIAVTAHAMPGDRARALAAGCDEYITKPIDFRRLFQAIEQQLQKRR